MLIVNIVIFFLSLAILVASADILVRLSSNVAAKFNLSPLVIGATVVALGTSLPELAVTVSSIFQGSSEISLGNIIGSNIANIGLILGISLAFNPLRVGTTKTQRNNLFLLVVTAFFVVLQLFPFSVRRPLATLLLVPGALFVFMEMVWGREGSLKEDLLALLPRREEKFSPLKGGLLLSSILGLGVSSHFLVESSTYLALSFGVSQEVVGLSLIAVGTSLPELSVSILAAVKKEEKLLLGNLIGSNIINLTLLGSVATMFSDVSSYKHNFSLAALVFFTTLAFLIIRFFGGRNPGKSLGIFLLLSYACYIFVVYH